MTDDKSSRFVLWSGPFAVFAVISLLIALLLPAVQQAREAARRTQSKNNLKQIGLALHNYHDTFDMFPPGGIFNAEGTAFHGWTSSIAPYMDCSPFYNTLNFNIPWDDPQQVEKFITGPHPVFLNPSVQPTKSLDGIPLVHYAANEWLFHRNSSMRIRDIETGTSNTLAMADAFGNFAPLGYPYNWRDPLIPINTSPDGFGYNLTGMHALLVDGTVRWIAKDMATEIHASFAGPEKLRPTAEEVEKPAGEYRLGFEPWQTKELYVEQHRTVRLRIRINSADKPVEAVLDRREDNRWKPISQPYDEALNSLDEYPTVPKFDAGIYLSDVGVKHLTRFEKLEWLSLGGKRITDTGAVHLAAMPALRTLTLDQTEITAKGLTELGRLTNLSTLTIVEPKFGDDGVRALLHCVALTELELTWYLRPVDVTPAAVVDLLNERPDLAVQIRVQGRRFDAKSVRELVAAERDWTGNLISDPEREAAEKALE